MLRAGVSYRHPMAIWIDSRPPDVDFLEIPSEMFVRPEMWNRLAVLTKSYPLAIRSTALSIGTPGALREDLLAPLAGLASMIKPLWVSELIAFSRTAETNLGRPCPVIPSDETVAIVADHAREIASRCGCPVLLENIASPLRFGRPLPEPDFLNRLCARSGCKMLLDVTALFVGGRNHGFEPLDWLSRFDPAHIAQIHVAGYRSTDTGLADLHDAEIQGDIWDLVRQVLIRSPDAGGIIEHDVDIPPVDALEEELKTLECAGAAP